MLVGIVGVGNGCFKADNGQKWYFFLQSANYRKTDSWKDSFIKKNTMKIPCICIDDKNRPLEIPVSKWVKYGQKYHITHVYRQLQQDGIKGVELAEFDISDCVPYNCYRLGRFAFTQENVQKLMSLMNDCTELDNVDINAIVDKLFLVK